MKRKINRFLAGLVLVGIAAFVVHAFLPEREHLAAAGPAATDESVAPGVVYRAIATGSMAGVDLIDVDMAAAKVRLGLGVGGIKRGAHGVTGRAFTPEQWLTQTNALAAVNGGYFGNAASSDREQVVGLLMLGGKVVQAQPAISGHGGRHVVAGRYVRSAFGITASGAPSIAWIGTVGTTPMSYRSPTNLIAGKRWRVRDAFGCGPTLIANGRIDVHDYAERLVNSGERERTFVAYDTLAGQPRHFVMGVASSMTFQTLADFIAGYFQHYHAGKAARAMCFDGGSSSQLSYRGPSGVTSPLQTGVTVPVALLLLPRR